DDVPPNGVLNLTAALVAPAGTITPPPLTVTIDGLVEMTGTQVGAGAGSASVTCSGVPLLGWSNAPAGTSLNDGPNAISPGSRPFENSGSALCARAPAATRQPIIPATLMLAAIRP